MSTCWALETCPLWSCSTPLILPPRPAHSCRHLAHHPSLRESHGKEPNLFTKACDYDPLGCPLKAERQYLRRVMRMDDFLRFNGSRGHFEGSTHYVRAGKHIAAKLRTLLPWVKCIVQLREPISRAISMLVHNADGHKKGCLHRQSVGYCLLNASQLRNTRAHRLPDGYTKALQHWVDTQPADKLLFVQVSSWRVA